SLWSGIFLCRTYYAPQPGQAQAHVSTSAGFAKFIHSRTRSPRFDLHVSAVFFEGAAYLIVFAFWAGAPGWVGVVVFVALLATETCCSRSPSSGRKLP